MAVMDARYIGIIGVDVTDIDLQKNGKHDNNVFLFMAS